MPRLILTEPGGRSRDIALTGERTTIGRHVDNDVVLNDKAVSGRHAVLLELADGRYIEDLNSTNGTLVNGSAVSRQALAEGDVISIGRNTLRYTLSAPEPAAASEPEPEPTAATPSETAAGAVVESQVPAAGPATIPPPALSGARLTVESGVAAGRSVSLLKPLTTFGKAGVQVAGIRREGMGYVLVGIEGPRPRLNDAEITDEVRMLVDGDRIDVGGTRMRFNRV